MLGHQNINLCSHLEGFFWPVQIVFPIPNVLQLQDGALTQLKTLRNGKGSSPENPLSGHEENHQEQTSCFLEVLIGWIEQLLI